MLKQQKEQQNLLDSSYVTEETYKKTKQVTMGKGKQLEGIITGEEINHCTNKHFNSRNSQFVWKLLKLFCF